MGFLRAWDPDGWQTFALQLVQLRHNPQNVQIVPDAVRGDAGIEFFSTNGCLYQCYAPEEVTDVSKAASAMKEKARRDLNKLVKFSGFIQRILQNLCAERWILLCPFLDDKDVVAYVRAKGVEIKNQRLSFLADNFEALVQSQDDFNTELEHLRLQSLGIPLKIEPPSDEVVDSRAEGGIRERLTEKLLRAFPNASLVVIEGRVLGQVRAHLIRENALESLRVEHAILWERSVRCLQAEEGRLIAVGAGSGAPSDQLIESIKRIEQSLRNDLPDLSTSAITQIATGTISDWLIRCPLDFPEGQ
jgi:hypothetical protein